MSVDKYNVRSALAMSEAALQSNVIDTARKLGWRVAHFRPALTMKGWRTPVEADGKGFPDLIMLRGCQCLVVELKSTRGATDPDQDAWLDAFGKLYTSRVRGGVVKVCVWRPIHWIDGTIAAVLSEGQAE